MPSGSGWSYEEVGVDGYENDKNERFYTVTIQFFHSNFAVDPKTVRDLVTTDIFDSYTPDPVARCKKKTAKQVSLGEWEVTLEFDTIQLKDEKEDGEGPEGFDDPLLRPWQISFGAERATKWVVQDVNGDDIKNSAGQPLEPIEVPVVYPTINVTLNVATFDYADVTKYTNKINSGIWEGFPIGTVRCVELNASSFWENGTRYWSKNVTLMVNDDGWNPLEIADMGTMTSSDGYNPDECVEIKGIPVPHPVALNGAGQVKTTAGLHFLEFDIYKEESFALLL